MKIKSSEILGFVVSILIMIIGMVLLFDAETVILGFSLIFAGLLFFPSLLQVLKQEMNIELNKGLRLATAVILIIIGFTSINNETAPETPLNKNEAKAIEVKTYETKPKIIEPKEEEKEKARTCLSSNFYIFRKLKEKYLNYIFSDVTDSKKVNEDCSVELRGKAYDLSNYEIVKFNSLIIEDENGDLTVNKFESEKIDSTDKAHKLSIAVSDKQLVYVSTDKANLREKPINGKVIEALEEEVSAKIIIKDSKNKDWYLVSLQDPTNKGTIGWVHKNLLITEAGYKKKIELEFLENKFDLIIQKWNFSKKYSNFVVEGQVLNKSGMPLNYLKAIFTGKDKNGNFVTSDFGYVEYNPLLPDQKSPFKFYVDYNPAITQGSVDFSVGGLKLKTTSKQVIKKMREEFNLDDYRPSI